MLTWENVVVGALSGACLGVAVTYLFCGRKYATLRQAVIDLYYSAHWIPTRPCDAGALWRAVRDAAEITTGASPPATTAVCGQWLEWPSGVAVRSHGTTVGVILPNTGGSYNLTVVGGTDGVREYFGLTYDGAKQRYLDDSNRLKSEFCRPPLGPGERYYDVTLTRDTSESTTVTVAAVDADAAEDAAMLRVGSYGENCRDWSPDDNTNKVYLTGKPTLTEE